MEVGETTRLRVVDVSGHVLVPAMAEPHAHVDKAYTADEYPNPTGDLAGAILVSQVTLFFLLIPRFWQRGIAVTYYLQNMVKPVVVQPFSPAPVVAPVVIAPVVNPPSPAPTVPLVLPEPPAS